MNRRKPEAFGLPVRYLVRRSFSKSGILSEDGSAQANQQTYLCNNHTTNYASQTTISSTT
jgi:hypothetical protein